MPLRRSSTKPRAMCSRRPALGPVSQSLGARFWRGDEQATPLQRRCGERWTYLCADARAPGAARSRRRIICSGMAGPTPLRIKETPGSSEPFWYPQHPNEVFGCRAARTRCGPVIADSPTAPLTLGVPLPGRAPNLYEGFMRREPALLAALLFPMANPSSQVSVVVGFPTPSRRPETEEPTLGTVSPRRTCQ